MLAKLEPKRNVQNFELFDKKQTNKQTNKNKFTKKNKKTKQNKNEFFKTIFDMSVDTILKDVSVAETSV